MLFILKPFPCGEGQKLHSPASESPNAMDADNLGTTLPPWAIRAGARQTIYFDPTQVYVYVWMNVDPQLVNNCEDLLYTGS